VAGLLIVVLALSVSITFAQTGTQPELGKESQMVDAQWYASHYGVSLDDALLRLQIQKDIDGLEGTLLDREKDTFAGLWIQHTPQFRIVAAFTHDGEKIVQPYIEKKYWAKFVEARSADATFEELEAAQKTISLWLGKEQLNIPAESLIDVINNRVELRVTDRAKLDSALYGQKLQLPPHVEIITVAHLSTLTADIFGGKRIDGPNDADCTSGFSVVHTDGTRGVTIAGHCPDEGMSYNGVNLPLRSATLGGPWDVQWHQASQAFTVRNLIFDGTYNRYIYSIKSRDSQKVGETVCKYGVTTGSGCGTIQSKTFCPPNMSCTFIRVTGAGVAGGDSGGPTFWNNTAYGTIRSTTDGSDFVYMAANYISTGLSGVTVLTY